MSSSSENSHLELPDHGSDRPRVVLEPLGSDNWYQLEERLKYTFKDRDLLERALTHRSVHGQGTRSDYERFEFLGDAVFDLAVAHLLLEQHPQADEGALSKMRAALVNTVSLAEVAREIGLGRFIRLSRGELTNGGADRPSILADVLEAVLGAVYREAGFEVARACVENLLGQRCTTVNPRDPKTELQEVLHAAGNRTPVYRLECVEGPEHQPIFVSLVEVDGEVLGRGRGATKKGSQQSAAEEALLMLRKRAAQAVQSGDRPSNYNSIKTGQDIIQGEPAKAGSEE